MTAFISLLACFSCDNEDPPTPAPSLPGKPGETLERTLIIYMVGENTLSGGRNYVLLDSLEIAQGLARIGVNHRVVVYIDDTKSSRLCVGTREEPLQVVKTYNRNICSTDSADMEMVLKDIIETYPASNYGLVLWSHASGWLPAEKRYVRKSFGVDNGMRSSEELFGEQMPIPTLAHVLGHFPHFEFVFFDACFMQCVEVAYELRRVTDYVVGSPAEIPGLGAPYELLLQPMCRIPADIEGMLNGYVDYYLNDATAYTYDGVELSAIRTSELEALAQATAPYLKRLFDGRSRPDCSQVQRFFFNPYFTKYTEFYDMENLMYQHLEESEYTAWRDVLDRAVPVCLLTEEWYSSYPYGIGSRCRVTDIDHTGGVSICVPSESFKSEWLEEFQHMEWYKDTGLSSTGW